MHRLDLPAVRDQLGGQPIQQLGVGRRLAQLAEVVGGRHDGPAEVILPEAIRQHARRPRVSRVRQPIGQRPSLAASPGERPGARVEHLGHSRLDGRADQRRAAAEQHVRLGSPSFGDGHHVDPRPRTVVDLLQVLPVRMGHVDEEGQEPVVIALGDRIDLVIVASGAVDRHAQDDLSGGGDDAIERIVSGLRPVGRFIVPDPQAVESRRDQGLGRAGVDLVAGQLLADELVVRLVAVVGVDHIIAVAPGEGLGRVALVTVGLAEPDQVEPVPGPVLAIVGRGEQSVDQALVSPGRSIGEEGVNLLGGRRQPGQVVGQPADEGHAIGLRGAVAVPPPRAGPG